MSLVRRVLLSLAVLLLFTVSTDSMAKQPLGATAFNDPTTGLQWLEVFITLGMSFDEVIAQSGAGGEFYGWRYATIKEVESLLYVTFNFPDLKGATSGESPSYIPPVEYFMSRFGVTFDMAASYGHFYFFGAKYDTGALNTDGLISLAIRTGEAGVYSVNDCCNLKSQRDAEFGSFLVREVPEPASMYLFSIGMIVIVIGFRSLRLV